MKNYLSLFVWLLISIPLYNISCNNNVIEINGVYSDEDIENRMGNPDFVRVIVLKPDSSLSLYEYQNGLYQFIPNKDSLIVFEQIYKTGFKKKIIWLTEYEKKKRVLDILEYDTLKTHF